MGPWGGQGLILLSPGGPGIKKKWGAKFFENSIFHLIPCWGVLRTPMDPPWGKKKMGRDFFWKIQFFKIGAQNFLKIQLGREIFKPNFGGGGGPRGY